jgi:hypothetical protein
MVAIGTGASIAYLFVELNKKNKGINIEQVLFANAFNRARHIRARALHIRDRTDSITAPHGMLRAQHVATLLGTHKFDFSWRANRDRIDDFASDLCSSHASIESRTPCTRYVLHKSLCVAVRFRNRNNNNLK